MIKIKSEDIQNNRVIITSSLAILFSVALLVAAPAIESCIISTMGISGFLSWHNLLEIAGIIACMAIYLISYYTYKQEKNVKPIIFGSLLMAAGSIDVFHMLSYKGMPDFFISNTTANRATTFWIVARLISTAAYMAICFIHNDRKSGINGNWFSAAAIAIILTVFTVATYYPNLLPPMYIEGSGLTFVKKVLEYLIIVVTSIVAVVYFHKYRKTKNKVLYVLFAALVLSIISEFTFTVYIDVHGVYNLLGHVIKCISLFMLFSVTFSKYILTPYTALTDAQNELKEYADNLDKLVEQRTSELKMINNMLLEDLDYARDIQNSMMPTFFPNSSQISFNALYMPAKRLSGDFYDVYWLDENHIGFYVCDVSGHGVPAAMLTVFIKQCVDSFIEADRLKETISSPSEMLGQIYDAFNHTNFRDEVYIVLIYFVYDLETKKLVYSSAGMNEAPIRTNEHGDLSEIDTTGFPICKLKDLYEIAYEDKELHTNPGEKLFIYTDGLIEMRNDKKEQYSSERFRQLILNSSQTASELMIYNIRRDLKLFAGDREPEDDITLLCVEFR